MWLRAARLLAEASAVHEPRSGPAAYAPDRAETAAGAVLRLRRAASPLGLVPVARVEAAGA